MRLLKKTWPLRKIRLKVKYISISKLSSHIVFYIHIITILYTIIYVQIKPYCKTFTIPLYSWHLNYFFSLDTSLYCPTSVIVTTNISQEKTMENPNDENEKIGKQNKCFYLIYTWVLHTWYNIVGPTELLFYIWEL